MEWSGEAISGKKLVQCVATDRIAHSPQSQRLVLSRPRTMKKEREGKRAQGFRFPHSLHRFYRRAAAAVAAPPPPAN